MIEIENTCSRIKNEGNVIMTENELKLIKLIRENDNSEEAIFTAVSIITSFLEQEKSFVGQVPVCLPELA
jgi:hypothetical protein